MYKLKNKKKGFTQNSHVPPSTSLCIQYNGSQSFRKILKHCILEGNLHSKDSVQEFTDVIII